MEIGSWQLHRIINGAGDVNRAIKKPEVLLIFWDVNPFYQPETQAVRSILIAIVYAMKYAGKIWNYHHSCWRMKIHNALR